MISVLFAIVLSKGIFAQELEPKMVGKIDRTEVVGTLANWTQPQLEAINLDFKIDKFVLDNGLTVLVHTNKRVPLISLQTWFRVGSIDETPGETGLAHLFEHMMFKGTEKYPKDKFQSLIEANGMVNNAFTTHDYTGYYELLPSNKIDVVFDVESDRMKNLTFSEADFKSEVDVVKDERRLRIDNQPLGVLRETVYSTVFKQHPAKWPVIGYMKDLESMKFQAAKDFHQRFYGPNNAVLVVAGNVSLSEVKTLVNKYYAQIPRREFQRSERTPEPAQISERLASVERNVQNTTVAIAFPGAKAQDMASYDLSLAAAILGGGPSSRLHQKLVDDLNLATFVYAHHSAMRDNGIFEVFVGLRPGVSQEAVVSRVINEIWNLRNKSITEIEFKKVQASLLSGFLQSMVTIQGRAEALASAEIIFGDYNELFKFIPNYQSRTPESLKKAAEQFLQPKQRSLVVLRPRSGGVQ